MNTAEQAEILKGGSNHYRLKVLNLLETHEKLTLDEIVERLQANYKTIAVHVSRLHRSGLVTKKYQFKSVEHALTPRARQLLSFLRKLE